MDKLLYGAAYYDEYMPYDRLDKDIEMMKAAGMNVVRIAESTWATCEPQPGVFDFSHVTRVIDAMEKAGMYVIVGTPTYAIPSWMEKMHPEVMEVQKNGRHIYGARQCMDITSPAYLFYAERVIRKLMEVTAHRSCVIGFQLDNETKYYDTAGENVQRLFVKYLREKFSDPSETADYFKVVEDGRKEVGSQEYDRQSAGSQGGKLSSGGPKAGDNAGSSDSYLHRRLSDDEALERMNYAFGLDYWSNRINSWEDFPDVRGTINGSLAAEFDRFRRQLVTDFLSWQASIVREYARPDQFITHNFDYEWRGWSFGVQPMVDHFKAAKGMATAEAGQTSAIAGCDIYHPSQNELTGREIAFGGDMNRSLLGKNYLILETEAQGYPWWTPYPGQLRLQAYSHLASGADMVEYWHWHSLHNAFETYWKGVLSHDFEENAVYREAKVIGNEWKKIGDHLIHLRKDNKAAILVSNEALSGLEYFKIDAISGDTGKVSYNDIVRWIYDALYDMNIECDFVNPQTEDLSSYKLLVVPALYSAPQSTLERINQFAENGGVVIETFKSAFTDEHVKVWTDTQPHELKKGAGVIYHEFAFPEGVGLKGKLRDSLTADERDADGESEHLEAASSAAGDRDAVTESTCSADGRQQVYTWAASLFMELLEPQGAEVLLSYDHPAWGSYAAVTRNAYGKGTVYYIGCKTSAEVLKKIIGRATEDAGVWQEKVKVSWPLIVRKGRNQYGREITYLLNYSGKEQSAVWQGSEADVLLPESVMGSDPNKHLPENSTASVHEPASIRPGDEIQIEPWGVLIFEEE